MGFLDNSGGIILDAVLTDTGRYRLAETETEINSGGSTQGVINGETLGSSTFIRIDQGLDTTEKSPAFSLDEDLIETGYIVEVDNRFATITTNGGVSQTYSFLDDDSVATYVFNRDVDTDLVRDNPETDTLGTEVIRGPRGTILEFSLKSSLDLNTGTFLFTEIGSTDAATFTGTLYYLDTNIRVTGLTTGYRIDIPVRYYKCSSC